MHYIPGSDPSFNNIFGLLNVDKLMSRFKSLYLELKLREFNIPEYLLEPKLESGWEKLDKVLTGPYYPSLSQVKITISVYVKAATFDEKLLNGPAAAKLEECLPHLSTSDKISLIVNVKCVRQS
jgi:hypothetical protein